MLETFGAHAYYRGITEAQDFSRKFFQADRYYSYSDYPLINHYELNYVISENTDRNVTGLPEAMGCVTQSRSLPAGAARNTADRLMGVR